MKNNLSLTVWQLVWRQIAEQQTGCFLIRPNWVCLHPKVRLTYDGGEAPRGFLPCDQLVQLREVEFQTFQKGHVAPLSFRVEDVEQTA